MTKKIEQIHVFSAEDLKALYDDSALTMTGLKVESIPAFPIFIFMSKKSSSWIVFAK